jgi:hypothetical protein
VVVVVVVVDVVDVVDVMDVVVGGRVTGAAGACAGALAFGATGTHAATASANAPSSTARVDALARMLLPCTRLWGCRDITSRLGRQVDHGE